MLHRVFVIATILSTVLLVLTTILFIGCLCDAFYIDPRAHHLSITDGFHVAVWRGSIAFFNDGENGPYGGSIIALSSGVHPARMDKAGYDFPGIYYRYFRFWDSGEVIWTVMVSLVYPAAILSILPVMWLWCRRRRTGRLLTDSSVEGDHAR
jgi:hypothetical protein